MKINRNTARTRKTVAFGKKFQTVAFGDEVSKVVIGTTVPSSTDGAEFRVVMRPGDCADMLLRMRIMHIAEIVGEKKAKQFIDMLAQVRATYDESQEK